MNRVLVSTLVSFFLISLAHAQANRQGTIVRTAGNGHAGSTIAATGNMRFRSDLATVGGEVRSSPRIFGAQLRVLGNYGASRSASQTGNIGSIRWTMNGNRVYFVNKVTSRDGNVFPWSDQQRWVWIIPKRGPTISVGSATVVLDAALEVEVKHDLRMTMLEVGTSANGHLSSMAIGSVWASVSGELIVEQLISELRYHQPRLDADQHADFQGSSGTLKYSSGPVALWLSYFAVAIEKNARGLPVGTDTFGHTYVSSFREAEETFLLQ